MINEENRKWWIFGGVILVILIVVMYSMTRNDATKADGSDGASEGQLGQPEITSVDLMSINSSLASIGNEQVAQGSQLDSLSDEVASLSSDVAELKEDEVEDIEENIPLDVVYEEWASLDSALYFDNVVIEERRWEFPKGTHSAVSTENGRYEAVESAVAGEVDDVEHGWCADDQYDCPPHAALLYVEIPKEFMGCFTSMMDISWRVMLVNDCDESVPVRFGLRFNTERSDEELMDDYLALAGLTSVRSNFLSDTGLFVASRIPGDYEELVFEDDTYEFGYSCWDCLADTQGPEGDVVPLNVKELQLTEPDTQPLGDSRIPGLVFPMPRPLDDGLDFIIEIEILVTVDTSTMVWIGRYDVPNSQ